MRIKLSAAASLLFVLSARASAGDLTIGLKGSQTVTRKSAQFRCDANGAKLGLPAGLFAVEYIEAGKNSLAILPISGASLIFANVTSASGSRYAAANLIWWEAGGRSVTLTANPDSLNGKIVSDCQIAR